MIDLRGIQYFFTVPIGFAAGLTAALIIALVYGPTWWLVAPPVFGFWLGVRAGRWME